MSDSPQLHRQWKVLRLLDSSRTGWTLNELVSETDVSKKTVRRDLRVLQAQFPVSEVTQDGVKRWRMTPLKEQLNFQLTELMAVYLSSCLLEPLAGTPFWEGSRSVVQKVKGALGASGVQYLQKMAAGLATTATGSGNYEQRGELIDQLLVGIEDHAVTEIRYQSLQAEVPQSRSVHPLGLVHHRGRLYLIAWSPDHDDVRNYKVDRIESAQVQSQRFELPLEFDLSDWLRQCFGVWRSSREALQTIRVRFLPQAARYVMESTWHESQQLTPQPDGSLIAEFHLPDTEEIKRWVLSFGQTATVLEPAALVQDMRQELQQTLQSYSGDDREHTDRPQYADDRDHG